MKKKDGLRERLNVGTRNNDELLRDTYFAPQSGGLRTYSLQSNDEDRDPWDYDDYRDDDDDDDNLDEDDLEIDDLDDDNEDDIDDDGLDGTEDVDAEPIASMSIALPGGSDEDGEVDEIEGVTALGGPNVEASEPETISEPVSFPEPAEHEPVLASALTDVTPPAEPAAASKRPTKKAAPAKKAVRKVAKKVAKKAAPAKKAAKKTAKKAATVKNVTKKLAPAKKAVQQPAKKAAKKMVKPAAKPAKKAAPTKKAAKK